MVYAMYVWSNPGLYQNQLFVKLVYPLSTDCLFSLFWHIHIFLHVYIYASCYINMLAII